MRKYSSVFLSVIILCLILSSCEKKTSIVEPPIDTTHVDTTHVPPVDTTIFATYGSIFSDTTDFGTGVRFGSITDAAIPEASGLAASRHYAGWFWTHNDSGNPNTIFLIDSLGTVRAVFTITGKANRDWEDIAIGPGPTAGVDYIYLGEIGDNDAKHATSMIYRFPEPTITVGATKVTSSIDNAEQIAYVYQDGAHNAETLMVDPLTKDIYIASKGGNASVYVIRYPQRTDSTITIRKIALLPLSTLTAGDISPAGDEIIMKNYGQIYYWKRDAKETIQSALVRTPVLLPYTPEVQGEGLCWSVTADAYWTTSELDKGIIPPITRYLRKK